MYPPIVEVQFLLDLFHWIFVKSIYQAVPEGDTAYVLTVEETGDHWLWNPVSGEHMTTRETFCPLESVYAIANESEIFILLVLII